jgi:hypothetical protein
MLVKKDSSIILVEGNYKNSKIENMWFIRRKMNENEQKKRRKFKEITFCVSTERTR